MIINNSSYNILSHIFFLRQIRVYCFALADVYNLSWEDSNISGVKFSPSPPGGKIMSRHFSSVTSPHNSHSAIRSGTNNTSAADASKVLNIRESAIIQRDIPEINLRTHKNNNCSARICSSNALMRHDRLGHSPPLFVLMWVQKRWNLCLFPTTLEVL